MVQKEHGTCVAISAAIVGFFALTVSASAFGLSDEDYDYLITQQIERSDAPILDLSPKERQRVHDLINDPETAGDQTVRNKNVKDALAMGNFGLAAAAYNAGPQRVHIGFRRPAEPRVTITCFACATATVSWPIAKKKRDQNESCR
jgi:hypothetical protein